MEKQSFKEVADAMIKWLCENGHPHMTVIVTQTCAELVEGVQAHINDNHVKD